MYSVIQVIIEQSRDVSEAVTEAIWRVLIVLGLFLTAAIVLNTLVAR